MTIARPGETVFRYVPSLTDPLHIAQPSNENRSVPFIRTRSLRLRANTDDAAGRAADARTPATRSTLFDATRHPS